VYQGVAQNRNTLVVSAFFAVSPKLKFTYKLSNYAPFDKYGDFSLAHRDSGENVCQECQLLQP
jgi:hypothetical protein